MLFADKINLAMAIATGLSVIVSAAMAVLTYAVLKANRATVEAMQAQIEAASRPYIQIVPIACAMTTAIELHVKNIGSSSAVRLRLSLDQDYQFNAEEGEHANIRKYSAFSKEIQMLAPGSELRFLLGVGHRILNNSKLCPMQFSVNAEYEFEEKKFVEKTTIDLAPFGRSAQQIDPIAERLDKLAVELRSIRWTLKNAEF